MKNTALNLSLLIFCGVTLLGVAMGNSLEAALFRSLVVSLGAVAWILILKTLSPKLLHPVEKAELTDEDSKEGEDVQEEKQAEQRVT